MRISGPTAAGPSTAPALATAPAAPPAEPPPLERFHADNIRSLAGICRRVLDGAQALVAYVDGNRETAKTSGIEALAAEVSGIVEGGGLQNLQDHLDYALARNKGADLTLENLSRLNRAERLLSEANRALAYFSGSAPGSRTVALAGPVGQVPPTTASGSLDTLLIVAIVGLSAVGIAASIVAALAIAGERAEPPPRAPWDWAAED